MTIRLREWYYRANQAITPNRPKWLHVLLCSHCHGLAKWVRQQEKTRSPA